MTQTPIAPAVPVGQWCEVTRGFYEGGRYVTAGELVPGDVFRWHTYTGHAVDSVTREPAWRDYPEVVVIRYAGGTREMRLTAAGIVEVAR